MIFNLLSFLLRLIIEIEDRSNRNEENCFRNIRFCLLYVIVYIHFKLVLSLFNRSERQYTLSLSPSMLANYEKEEEKKKEENQKRKNIRAPSFPFVLLLSSD